MERIRKLEEGQASLVEDLNRVNHYRAAAFESEHELKEVITTLCADLKLTKDKQSEADNRNKLLNAKILALETTSVVISSGDSSSGSDSLRNFSEQMEKIASR